MAGVASAAIPIAVKILMAKSPEVRIQVAEPATIVPPRQGGIGNPQLGQARSAAG
jgi:hypothetical protein